MLTQQEFDAILAQLPEPSTATRPPARPARGIFDFNLAIARALRSVELSHALFNVLASIARQQVSRGYATMAQVAIDAGVSFNAVQQHLLKSAHLFTQERRPEREGSAGHFVQVTLTQEAVTLLRDVNARAIRYAKATPITP